MALMLNCIASVFGLFLKRDHSLSTAPRTVYFFKFVGLGSIAQSAFLLRNAREQFPKSKIVFVTFPGCAKLLKLYPEIDEVRVLRDKSIVTLSIDLILFFATCWRDRVDLVVDLEVHSKFSSILTGLSFARDRAGFGGVTSRFRTGLYSHLVYWNPTKFIGEAYNELGAAIGIDGGSLTHAPLLHPIHQAEARKILNQNKVDPHSIIIGVNPHASELMLERRWPLTHFKELIELLPENITCVIVGSPAERNYSEELVAMCQKASCSVLTVAGELSLEGSIALLKEFNLFISNDTGPMHLALLHNVQTISLWGPTAAVSYGLRIDHHHQISEPIYCSPCIRFSDRPPCHGDNLCMQRILAVRVYHKCSEILQFDPQSISALPPPKLKRVAGLWSRLPNEHN